MKTFYPTEDEFKNPVLYIDDLLKNRNAAKWGCVKIVPPSSFKPGLAFDLESKKTLPTRYQVLQELSQGKAFKQNNKGYTFEQFAQLAKQLETKELKATKDYVKLEEDYWNMVDNGKGEITLVEYAADVPTAKYGSGFGRVGQKIVNEKQKEYENHPWNLNNLPTSYNSLMQFPRKHDISGINIPWLYVGMKYATFCWHYEDLMLPSINYSHYGAPKQWYSIPESDREKFEKAVKQKVNLLFKKDPNILLDIVVMVSPAYLKQQGVSASRPSPNSFNCRSRFTRRSSTQESTS